MTRKSESFRRYFDLMFSRPALKRRGYYGVIFLSIESHLSFDFASGFLRSVLFLNSPRFFFVDESGDYDGAFCAFFAFVFGGKFDRHKFAVFDVRFEPESTVAGQVEIDVVPGVGNR